MVITLISNVMENRKWKVIRGMVFIKCYQENSHERKPQKKAIYSEEVFGIR